MSIFIALWKPIRILKKSNFLIFMGDSQKNVQIHVPEI